jgi:hypothetical protein
MVLVGAIVVLPADGSVHWNETFQTGMVMVDKSVHYVGGSENRPDSEIVSLTMVPELVRVTSAESRRARMI